MTCKNPPLIIILLVSGGFTLTWAGLVGDTLDLIPFVTGAGEVTKAISATNKIIDTVDDVHDTAKVVDNVGDTGKAISKNVDELSDDGIVYLRTDKKTGDTYVGQTKNDSRYSSRKKEHARTNPNAEYEFEVLGNAKPGKDLDILEQKMINEFGGLKKMVEFLIIRETR